MRQIVCTSTMPLAPMRSLGAPAPITGPSLPAGVTLQAIDGETMLTPTTMSHNYFASNGYTMATNTSFGAKSWDDPAFFPHTSFYGLGTIPPGLANFLDVGLNCSIDVTTNSDLTLLMPNQIWAATECKTAVTSGLGRPTENTPLNAAFCALNVDEDDPALYIGQAAFTGVIPGRFWIITGTWNCFVFSGPNSVNMSVVLARGNYSGQSIGIWNIDVYWFSGSAIDGTVTPFGNIQGQGAQVANGAGSAQWTVDQMARGSNYGNMIDSQRAWGNGTNVGIAGGQAYGYLAAGKSGATSATPFLSLVEVGDGHFQEATRRAILAKEWNWAVWSSIIHGARGIDSFSSISEFSTGIRTGDNISMYNQAKATIALINSLATVVTSPFALGYVTVSPHGYLFPIYESNWQNGGIECCAKFDGTSFYIFATTRNSQTVTNTVGTFTVADPAAHSAIVINENRSIPIVAGAFADVFAAASTVHLYKMVPQSLPQMIQHTASAALFPAFNVGASAYNNFVFTLPHAVGAGNCLVLCLVYQHGQTPTITDTQSNSWPGSPTVSADGGVGKFVSSLFVLPNAHAGVTTITVAFGTGSTPFHYTLTEFNNIATVSPVAGSHGTANVAGATLTAGSFTPTNNNATGGNVIYSFFGISNYSTSAQNPTAWAGDPTGGTLLDTDTAWANVSGVPHASQFALQSTSAAINAQMTATGVTSDSYNCVAVALKVASGAGTSRAAGIHIDRLIHQTTTQATSGGAAPSPLTLQMPMTGNLRVCSITNASAHTTSVTVSDSEGNTWTPVRASLNNAFFYLVNCKPNPNLTITITGLNAGGAGFQWYNSYRFYDISGAAASPFAGSAATAALTNNSPWTNAPSITPTGAPGLTLAWLGLNVAAPPLTVTSPSNNILDVCQYTNQTDADPMDNSDGVAHFFHITTAAQSWNWTEASGLHDVWDVAVAFKS